MRVFEEEGLCQDGDKVVLTQPSVFLNWNLSVGF